MDDAFNKLVQNAVIYGTAVMLMSMDEKMRLSTRVIPIEEYTELGEHLKWIAQNTKVPHDS